nr:MAG TPA: hypothetical protein [Caudoviricetes sp.]
MTDTGFGEGVTGKPLPADSVLRAMRKSELDIIYEIVS